MSMHKALRLGPAMRKEAPAYLGIPREIPCAHSCRFSWSQSWLPPAASQSYVDLPSLTVTHDPA
jgi:hypothetical protein